MNLDPLDRSGLVALVRDSWRRAEPSVRPLNGSVPNPGDVVRVSWDDFACLMIVESATPEQVTGHPASSTASFTDRTKQARTDDGLELVGWADAVDVDAIKVDAVIGSIPCPQVKFQEWWATQPHGVEPLSPGLHVHELREAIQTLTESPDEVQSETLPELLRSAHLEVTAIEAATHFDRPTLLKLFRGQRSLAAEEAAELAPVVGIDSRRLLHANPPLLPELRDALRAARWRPVVDRLVAGGRTHSESRNVLAYGAMSAARSGPQIDWNDRIQRYVEAARV